MDYDIGAAFEAIEDELIASMIRNMDRHRAWEDDEGIQWSMWQAEQMKALEKYKKTNQKKHGKQFKDINGQIGEILYKARQDGNMQQEIQILNAIKNGFIGANKVTQGAAAEFFRLNDRKLEALIQATTNDMERAETAILRKANDEYRKVIYNAQVYANTGAGTYEKAVDMATKDMLSRGLACVEYANGARHTLADYADMAIRTASKRAYLQGEGEKRQEWGITTVIMVKRGNPCPKCLPFVGKVLIDDVWSGGKKEDGPYPLMSKAIVAGLYHPRCKDSHTTYFPGVSSADDTWTKEELESIEQVNVAESKQQYAKRQAEKFDRLADRSLDEENQKNYAARREEWKKRQAKAKIPEITEKKEIEYDFKGKDEKFGKSRELIDKLSAEYNTHLENVTIGTRHAAGTVDMSGTTMHLSSADPAVAIHEFAHSMANSKATQYGVTHDDDFWKEIKAVRRRYRKEAGSNTDRWISSYEHSHKDVDEFFAEAFTQAKMHEMGLKLPGKYGTDTTYSQQVLEVTNRYFRKNIVKTVDSGIMELYRKASDPREGFKFISDNAFSNLTIAARKKGAVIIRGTKEAEEHLERLGAAASNIGDVLVFRKNVCVSEVLEEVHHFEQNLVKMNNDKSEPVRSILNEIEAKQYLLDNAEKYKIPRNEIELTEKQLQSYQKQLDKYQKGGV